jgi:glycosyltransferase involved in cell wall biosynthesis
MKILNLSSFDTSGGAARGAYRTHQGFEKIGIDSQMFVQYKTGDSQTVFTAQNKLIRKLQSMGDSFPLQFAGNSQYFFSLQWFPGSVASLIARLNPDVINLHWICNGFLPIEAIAKLNKPLVWTLHDMWPFTGGCHYSYSCDRYLSGCGNCPQLNSHSDRDLSSWVWQRKAKAWQNLSLTLIAPSTWMAECASASPLFAGLKIVTIPFGLDTNIYTPSDRKLAREILKLPQEKHLILFGAIAALKDERKGFPLLQKALQKLSQAGWQDKLELVIFGSSASSDRLDLDFKTHNLGHINDEKILRLAYSAVDATLAPSTQEAFGQIASEALACGTPVVAFERTGLADIVDSHQNGYLAKYGDIEDLARGIAWILEDKDGDRQQKLRHFARLKAETEFAMEVQARRYVALFEEILDKSQKSEVISN